MNSTTMATAPAEDGIIKERIYKEIDELVIPALSTRSTSYELEDNIKSGSPLMNAVMWVWRSLSLILADYLGTSVKQRVWCYFGGRPSS